MKNKLWIIVISIIFVLIIFLLIFYPNVAKKMKIGHTSSSQEIVEKILKLTSYETEIEVEVQSNKNKNKYKLKQSYTSPETNYQEVLEPSNISGVKIIKEGSNLKIENTKLNLTKIYENYQYMSDNNLDLSSFIRDYKENTKSKWEEKDETIIMETVKEQNEKKLYINKTTGAPIKMQIKDNNKNTSVYILYNKVDYKI